LKNILALGNAACNIVTSLEKYDEYKVYRIRNEGEGSKNTYIVPEMNSAEEYEDLNILSKIKFLSRIKEEVTFFVCGASKTSAMTLKILQSLYSRGIEIKVVYFQPVLEFLSNEQLLQEKAVKGILQQYARSGLFRDITMVDNKTLQDLLGDDANILEFYSQINSIFCDSYHMIEIFKNTKPVMSTFSKIRESCRIRTIGVSTINCEDKLFSPFNQEVEVLYYLGINEEKLKTQGSLLRDLTTSVKSRITDERKAYFGIYSTNYDNDYIYVEYFSPKIQLTEQ
jgi:hypothetical protein